MIMADWTPLRRALARCRNTNTALPIWWRDDDAIEPTAALDQLSALSENIGIPVHLAIIPKPTNETLVPYVVARPHIVACVHGWAHANTSPTGSKKSEFGVPRDGAERELKLALGRMDHFFGEGLLALFVPPWNRMDAGFQSTLAQLNYVGFSTFGPRQDSTALPQINTHLDPIFWRSHRGLIDTVDLIDQVAEILNARCNNTQDTAEPFGLLTHHLVHVPEIWEFCAAFMTEMLEGGAYPANLKEILA